MFDECCGLVYGNCSSDNEAQRIVNAIRITKDGTNTQTPKSYTSMFVTEYLYIDNNEGPTLVRLPKADWPEWATSYRTRFEILWGAIKNLFTGRGVWLSGRIQANIGDLELSSETWIKQEGEESLWEHWCVFFDGKKAVGYVNGQEVNK